MLYSQSQLLALHRPVQQCRYVKRHAEDLAVAVSRAVGLQRRAAQLTLGELLWAARSNPRIVISVLVRNYVVAHVATTKRGLAVRQSFRDSKVPVAILNLGMAVQPAFESPDEWAAFVSGMALEVAGELGAGSMLLGQVATLLEQRINPHGHVAFPHHVEPSNYGMHEHGTYHISG